MTRYSRCDYCNAVAVKLIGVFAVQSCSSGVELFGILDWAPSVCASGGAGQSQWHSDCMCSS